jgi:hypothetical protein
MLDVWEEWTTAAPDKAWAVYEEIVRLRPDDDEMLERIWSRLEWLLQKHGDLYHERISTLVHDNSRLARIAPPEQLARQYYAPNYLTPSELATVWLIHSSSASDSLELETLVRDDPEKALVLALELIHRGPAFRCRAFDLMSPLLHLLRQHGQQIIERVEAAAADSVAVRRALWSMRRQQSDPPRRYDAPADVWARAQRAAGDTTEYNSEDPPPVVTSLPPDLEVIVEAWFVYWYTFWAREELDGIVRESPEKAWEVICHLVDLAPIDDLLGSIAAGPLEDLLQTQGQRFVDRVEHQALENERFRLCLGGVWLSTRDLPRDLIDRFLAASDGELSVLEMEPPDPELLQFEREILSALLAGDHPVLQALRTQMQFAKVVERRQFGGHYDFELSVPGHLATAGGRSFTIADLRVSFAFASEPVDFYLEVENGCLKGLTGSLADDEWPSPILIQRICYLQQGKKRGEVVETEQRDVEALEKKLVENG